MDIASGDNPPINNCQISSFFSFTLPRKAPSSKKSGLEYLYVYPYDGMSPVVMSSVVRKNKVISDARSSMNSNGYPKRMVCLPFSSLSCLNLYSIIRLAFCLLCLSITLVILIDYNKFTYSCLSPH